MMQQKLTNTLFLMILVETLVVIFLGVQLYATAKSYEEVSSKHFLAEAMVAENKKTNDELIARIRTVEALQDEIIAESPKVAALRPLVDLLSDEELAEVLKELQNGNPFPGGHVVIAPWGKSVGYHGKYRENHKGADIAPADGKWEIYPYSPGVVEDFGYDSIYGKYIYVRHSPHVRSFYAHAEKIYYRATTGNYVDDTTVMMIMGETGLADGPHLHMEIQILTKKGWIAINPSAFLEE